MFREQLSWWLVPITALLQLLRMYPIMTKNCYTVNFIIELFQPDMFEEIMESQEKEEELIVQVQNAVSLSLLSSVA